MKDHKKRPPKSWLVQGGALVAGLLAHNYALAQPCPGPNCGATALEGIPVNAMAMSRRDRCPTMPPGAIPLPPGSHVHSIFDAQCAKAEADDFVFYKHEWYLGGRELGPYGRYHLNEVTKRLRKVPFPVVIQPTADRELNEIRRQLIVQYLKLNDIPDAELRVLVAFPEAEGLFGEEAERIYILTVGAGRGGGAYGAGVTPFGGVRGGFPGIGGGGAGGVGGIGVGGFRGGF
jgi:hypothetical protein